MHRKLNENQEKEAPPFYERIVMALLAPIFFNISLLICFSLLFRRSRFLLDIFTFETPMSGWGWIAILIFVPAITGYLLGVEKCATLLGHFFYTNMEHEKDLRKTVCAWACFFLIAYIISKTLPHA
jgi:hypothetical protein